MRPLPLEPFEQVRDVVALQRGRPVLAMRSPCHLPAQHLRHQLHPIADAQKRGPRLQHRCFAPSVVISRPATSSSPRPSSLTSTNPPFCCISPMVRHPQSPLPARIPPAISYTPPDSFFFFLMIRPPPKSTLFPSTTLSR